MRVDRTGGPGSADFEPEESQTPGTAATPEAAAPARGARKPRAETFAGWRTDGIESDAARNYRIRGPLDRGAAVTGTVRVHMGAQGPEFFLTREPALKPAERERPLAAAEREAFLRALERAVAEPDPQASVPAESLKPLLDAIEGAQKFGARDLGLLDPPGKALRGKTLEMLRGDTLRFRTFEVDGRGIAGFKVEPPGALRVTRKAVETIPPHLGLGPLTRWEWSVELPKDAKPGAKIRVTAEPTAPLRSDAGWDFSFEVKADSKNP